MASGSENDFDCWMTLVDSASPGSHEATSLSTTDVSLLAKAAHEEHEREQEHDPFGPTMGDPPGDAAVHGVSSRGVF
jgi:hypothetical protein